MSFLYTRRLIPGINRDANRRFFFGNGFWILCLLTYVLYAALKFTAYSRFSDPVILNDTEAFLQTAARPVDSVDFFTAGRPFGIPLLYKALAQKLELVAFLQVLLNVVAWPGLALLVASTFRAFPIKLLAVGVIIGLGLSPGISELDRLMLSESLSASLLALIIGTSIVLLARAETLLLPNSARSYVCIAAWTLLCCTWCVIHDLNSYMVLATAVIICVSVFSLKIKGYRISPALWGVPVVLLAMFALSALLMNKAERWRFPLSNVVAQRILPYPERVQFFEKEGLPLSAELKKYSGHWASSFDGMDTIPEYKAWQQKAGKAAYVKFLALNPRYTIASLWNNIPTITAGNYDYLYKDAAALQHRWPTYVEKLLTPTGYGIIPWLLIATITPILAARRYSRRGSTRMCIFIVSVITVSVFVTAIAYHGDEMEIGRHTLIPFLSIRISIWIGVLYVLDLISVGSSQSKYPTTSAI